jgi:RecA/RadA recombinase
MRVEKSMKARRREQKLHRKRESEGCGRGERERDTRLRLGGLEKRRVLDRVGKVGFREGEPRGNNREVLDDEGERLAEDGVSVDEGAARMKRESSEGERGKGRKRTRKRNQ